MVAEEGDAKTLHWYPILLLIGGKMFSPEGLKWGWWTPIWTPTKKRLQHQRRNLLIYLERATGIEPATLGLGSRCSTS
jgi:hypothetical protein